MWTLDRLCLAVLVGGVIGCAASHPGGYRPASKADAEERIVSDDYPDFASVWIGLPRLALQRLPDGHRELRLELQCSGCLPYHLIRIRTPGEQGAEIFGEALEVRGLTPMTRRVQFLYGPFPEPTPDSILMRLMDEREGCGPWQKALGIREQMVWCEFRGRTTSQWLALLSELDRLGVSSAPKDSGRPSFQVEVQDDGTVVSTTHRGCSDIAGSILLVEVLEGSEYRRSTYSCLEFPDGPSSQAAATAYSIMTEFLGLVP